MKVDIFLYLLLSYWYMWIFFASVRVWIDFYFKLSLRLTLICPFILSRRRSLITSMISSHNMAWERTILQLGGKHLVVSCSLMVLWQNLWVVHWNRSLSIFLDDARELEIFFLFFVASIFILIYFIMVSWVSVPWFSYVNHVDLFNSRPWKIRIDLVIICQLI